MRLLTAVSGVRVPQQAPEKHLVKGAFFLPCLRTRTPRASRAFGNAETTLRTPHWTRSARCAAIAIPSLRSLRGFESLSGSPPKALSVGVVSGAIVAARRTSQQLSVPRRVVCMYACGSSSRRKNARRSLCSSFLRNYRTALSFLLRGAASPRFLFSSHFLFIPRTPRA